MHYELPQLSSFSTLNDTLEAVSEKTCWIHCAILHNLTDQHGPSGVLKLQNTSCLKVARKLSGNDG